jgi:hypothetical protein
MSAVDPSISGQKAVPLLAASEFALVGLFVVAAALDHLSLMAVLPIQTWFWAVHQPVFLFDEEAIVDSLLHVLSLVDPRDLA